MTPVPDFYLNLSDVNILVLLYTYVNSGQGLFFVFFDVNQSKGEHRREPYPMNDLRYH